MSKIICDICGTTYPSTAECCPICGCSNDGEEALLGAEATFDDIPEENVAATVNTRKKEIFDFDEVNMEDTSEEDEETDFDDEDELDMPDGFDDGIDDFDDLDDMGGDF